MFIDLNFPKISSSIRYKGNKMLFCCQGRKWAEFIFTGFSFWLSSNFQDSRSRSTSGSSAPVSFPLYTKGTAGTGLLSSLTLLLAFISFQRWIPLGNTTFFRGRSVHFTKTCQSFSLLHPHPSELPLALHKHQRKPSEGVQLSPELREHIPPSRSPCSFSPTSRCLPRHMHQESKGIGFML